MSSEFSFIRDLSESRLVPDRHSLRRYTANEMAELAYLYVLSLRIMLVESQSREWARLYCRRSARGSDFRQWRSDGSDLYVMLHALGDEHAHLKGEQGSTDMHRERLGTLPLAILRWIRSAADHADLKDHERQEQCLVFARLDVALKIDNSSMRALRRLVAEWPDLKQSDRRLAMTRLLQFMRARARRGDFTDRLARLAGALDLELHGVENMEEEFEPKHSFLLSLIPEMASAGATGAASIAAVPGAGGVGGIGAGFDTDYTKSIYPAPSATSKPKNKKSVIRRR